MVWGLRPLKHAKMCSAQNHTSLVFKSTFTILRQASGWLGCFMAMRWALARQKHSSAPLYKSELAAPDTIKTPASMRLTTWSFRMTRVVMVLSATLHRRMVESRRKTLTFRMEGSLVFTEIILIWSTPWGAIITLASAPAMTPNSSLKTYLAWLHLRRVERQLSRPFHYF